MYMKIISPSLLIGLCDWVIILSLKYKGNYFFQMIKLICAFWTSGFFSLLSGENPIFLAWISPRKIFFNFLLCESPLQVPVCAAFAEVALCTVDWVPWHVMQLFFRWLKVQRMCHAYGKQNMGNYLLHKFYERLGLTGSL